MKKRLIVLFIVLAGAAGTVQAVNYVTWQAQQGDPNFWNYVGIEADDVPGVTDCRLKGPAMADYLQADWDPGRTQWYSRRFYPTLDELEQHSVGTWLLKLVYDDLSETVYAFTISGPLEEADFPPVPVILEPAQGAVDVIAEGCTLRWDSNGAAAVATTLGVEVGGEGFFYASYALPVSTAAWHPGWLEIGDAYFRLSYLIDHTADMMTAPALVSGPPVTWHLARASTASGVQHEFGVSYSLDLTGDDTIDLADLAIFLAHWLETK